MSKCGFLGSQEAITSLRSSGYRDSSMALGELIDNSIQANAKNIWIVLQTDTNVGVRNTKQVVSTAVVDDGCGMDPDLLQRSLVLGEGNNRNEEKGMGKFGMGLPQSSISQCKRVDVWSWTTNSPNKKHVYIDLNDPVWLNDAEIKEPDSKDMPNLFKQFIHDCPSGTIVQWSDLDQFTWKKPNTVYDRCETLIGRMYRYWLNEDLIKIKLIIVDKTGSIEGEYEFQAVDPLFLMENAKCGTPPEKPMFQMFKHLELPYSIPINGENKTTNVELTFSIAKDSVRLLDEGVAGRKDYGIIAKKCMGVSIVREGRELELNNQWVTNDTKDPRHRWWGAEIKFDRDLDEIFGVTNNKQSATRLNEVAGKGYEEIMEAFGHASSGDEDLDLKLLKEENPAQYVLVDVATLVKKYIDEMQKIIKQNTNRAKRERVARYTDTSAQERYDILVGDRSQSQSTISESDELALQRGKDRLSNVESALSDCTEEDKTIIIKDVEKGHRSSLLVSPQDSSSFFNVDRRDTQMVVRLNSSHPMYKSLFGIFDDIILDESKDIDEIRIKAIDAFSTLQFILLAWARMEDEEREPSKKRQYRQIREKWGEIMEDSYRHDD